MDSISIWQALQGTLVNGAAIVAGGALGMLLGNRLPDRFKNLVVQGISLAVMLIGIQMALETKRLLVVTFSLIIGGLLGEAIGVDYWLNRAGLWLEKKTAGSGQGIAKAFVFATLVYGIGAMAITGALESGILGRHQILYVKSVLDGVTAIAFAATMGVGVCLSAVPVTLYQGGIALAASSLRSYLGPEVIAELSSVGGLLILAIGLGMMEIKEIKVANFLPSLLVVAVWMAFLVKIG